MDKTYIETKGQAPTDWNLFLNQAEQGLVNEEEIKKYKDRAAEWTCCAVGNQCAIIPRESNGEPVDDQLFQLGYNFSGMVEQLKWKAARELLHEIEKQSAVVIRETLAQLNGLR